MRSLAMLVLTLTGLGGFVPPVVAQTAPRPALLLRLAALEELIGDLRFLVKEIGREEEGKQIEGLLKARTGPKGLEGIDVTKPIGLYANVKTSLNESEIVLLLPIADEKTFLDFLDAMNFKPSKGADGVYTLKPEQSPVAILFRFVNGYLHGMARLNEKMTLPAKEQLPDPAKVLASGGGALSLTANIDQIPVQVRKLAVSASSLILGEMKDQGPPAATEKQKALQSALLDEAARQVKALVEDGTTAQFRFDIGRATKEVSIKFSLDGKPGSTLVKNLASLRPAASVSAGVVGQDSVMGGLLHLALPDAVRKAAAPAIKEAIDDFLSTRGEQEKARVSITAKGLLPTATSGRLDIGVDLRGPSKKGKYTLVTSFQVVKGTALEKAVKELLDTKPAAAEAVTLDVAKVGVVNIHRVTQKALAGPGNQLFGTGPLYFALRDDAVLVTMGEDALEAIKAAAFAKPRAGQPLRLSIATAKLAPLLAVIDKDQKEAPAAAKKAFTEKGSDEMKLSIEASDRLEVRLSVKTAVLAFGSYLDQLKKKE